MQNEDIANWAVEHDHWHRLDFSSRQEMPVGELSLWKDPIWRFERKVAGSKDTRIYWNRVANSDKTRLTASQRSNLVEEFKVMLWSSISEAFGGKRPSAGSITVITGGIYHLSRFLAEEGLASLGSVDRQVIADYCDWVMAQLSEEDPDSPVTVGQITYRLTVVQFLERQAPVLKDSGCPAPKGRLLDKHVQNLARELAAKDIEWISPLPDEVAVQLVVTAERLLGQPAEEVISLQDKFLALRAEANSCIRGDSSYKRNWGNEKLIGYTFCALEGESRPWHPPLVKGDARNPLTSQIRRTIRLIRDACIIIIQACVGIRISEVCGLEVEDERTHKNLPSCISISEGASGLNELFFLHGLVFKLRETAEPAEWVIGARPKGSDALPLVVRAVSILQRLFGPWRKLGETKALVVTFHSRKGLPRMKKNIQPPSSASLTYGLKDFASRLLDWDALPALGKQGVPLTAYKQSKGWNIRVSADVILTP